MDTLTPKASPSEARRAVFRERVGIWVQAHEEEAGRIKVHHLTGRDLRESCLVEAATEALIRCSPFRAHWQRAVCGEPGSTSENAVGQPDRRKGSARAQNPPAHRFLNRVSQVRFLPGAPL